MLTQRLRTCDPIKNLATRPLTLLSSSPLRLVPTIIMRMSFNNIHTNENGGLYQNGRWYDLPKKVEIHQAYFNLLAQTYPEQPTTKAVAKHAKVSEAFARKVLKEIEHYGEVIDPKELTYIRKEYDPNKGAGSRSLLPEHEMFLLSLRSENPCRPLSNYRLELYRQFDVSVSETTISRWFNTRFEFKGNLRKPNLVPLDKFRPLNILRYADFMATIKQFDDHTIFNWIDEKHIVNKDTLPKRVRADPITGRVDCIPVSGDFREAYNLIGCISANPNKPCPVYHTIGKNNGTAEAFTDFVNEMIINGFLRHGEVVIIDNAAIHTCGEASIVEQMLWDTVIDGMPLNVLVLYLPTRSPELNPIELVFHILSVRLRDWRNYGDVNGSAVVQKTKEVLDNLEYDTVLKCAIHCGY